MPARFRTAIQDKKTRHLLYSRALTIFPLLEVENTPEEKRASAYLPEEFPGARLDDDRGDIACTFCKVIVTPGHVSCPGCGRGVLYRLDEASPVDREMKGDEAEEKAQMPTGSATGAAGGRVTTGGAAGAAGGPTTTTESLKASAGANIGRQRLTKDQRKAAFLKTGDANVEWKGLKNRLKTCEN